MFPKPTTRIFKTAMHIYSINEQCFGSTVDNFANVDFHKVALPLP